jgi:SAM-dependent methyltransferase
MAGAHSPSWFETRRQHLDPVGLPRDLLRNAAQVNAVENHFAPLLKNPAVRDAMMRDEVPIPAADDREGYFDERHLSYWLSGYDDLQVVRQMVPDNALSRVLDFGGASGRFARHVILADRAASVTIAELNVNHVAWVDQHFGPSVRAVKVSPYPYCPVADNSMTLCVGMSVFTHIDSYETGWLAEIHRVLDEGGYAFLTIHSEHTWGVLDEHTGVRRTLANCPSFASAWERGKPMPAERMVFTYNEDSIEHNCNVFAHTDYIRRCWGKWFDIVEIAPGAHHGFQTVVVLRKRTKMRLAAAG